MSEQLSRMSQFRPDIFSTTNEVQAKLLLQQELQKAREKEIKGWDGHAESTQATTSLNKTPFDEQVREFAETLRKQDAIGPQVPGYDPFANFVASMVQPPALHPLVCFILS